MQPAASPSPYDRVLKLLKSRQPLGLVAALAVVEALLGLLLLIDVGLIVALLDTRGVCHLSAEDAALVPSWVRLKLPSDSIPDFFDLPNTGLTPIIVQNQHYYTPWTFGVGAELLRPVVAHLKPLQSNYSALLTLLAVGLALLLLLLGVVQWRWRLVATAAVDAASSLRRQIHRQVYRLGRSALPNEGISPVVNLFMREVNDVQECSARDLESVVRAPLVAVGLLLVVLALSWPLAVFLVSLFTLIWLASGPLRRTTGEETDVLARAAATQLCLLHEDLGLVRTVRVFGMETYDQERFDEHLGQYKTAEARRMQAESGLPMMTVLLYGMATAVGLGLLARPCSTGVLRTISPAAALVLVACLLALFRLLSAWRRQRQARRRAIRSAGAIFVYLDRRPDLLMQPEAQFLPPLRQAITFENVTLETSPGRPVLSALSLEIPAGSRVALLSLDEDAKQALTCLIPRLIDPTVGRIRIDGRDLREVTLESLRAQVATLFQADLVFSDTVFANIALGDSSYALPRVIEAAKSCACASFHRGSSQRLRDRDRLARASPEPR